MMNKEVVLNILGAEFTANINLDYFMTDYKGDNVDLKTCNKINLFLDNQFTLICEKGIITIETTGSNQEINTEWMSKLNKLTDIKNVLQTMLNLKI